MTDERELKQLQYIRRILNSESSPADSNGVWDYYILSTGEHPEAVKVDRNTKEVKVVTEEQAKELIKKIEEEKARKLREEKAEEERLKALEENKESTEGAGLDDGEPEIDPNTGLYVPRETQPVDHTKETPREAPAKETTTDDKPHATMENQGSMEHKPDTQSFMKLMDNRGYRMRVSKLIKSKWKGFSGNVSDMKNLLRSHDIEVDAIGTSKEDIDSWVKTIEDCR